jgi:hypothetical protein
MLSHENLKKKYQTFLEHFGFRDFLGLSALILGLLLSNSATEKINPSVEKAQKTTSHETQTKTKSAEPEKPKSKKKIMKVSKKEKQKVTAAHQ